MPITFPKNAIILEKFDSTYSLSNFWFGLGSIIFTCAFFGLVSLQVGVIVAISMLLLGTYYTYESVFYFDPDINQVVLVSKVLHFSKTKFFGPDSSVLAKAKLRFNKDSDTSSGVYYLLLYFQNGDMHAVRIGTFGHLFESSERFFPKMEERAAKICEVFKLNWAELVTQLFVENIGDKNRLMTMMMHRDEISGKEARVKLPAEIAKLTELKSVLPQFPL
jgi:hypothetical protein